MKKYFLQFGSGDPRTFTGLSPTFLIFESAGVTLVPPAISEDLTGSGIYSFSWGTTTYVAGLADAATTSPGAAGRYVVVTLDPVDRMDEVGTSLIALGTTSVAQNVSLIALGTTSVAIGTTGLGYGVSNIALGTTAVAIGTTLIGIGLSNISLGTTIVNLIGTTAAMIGNDTIMPSSLFGYMRRVDALLEGQEQFVKGNPATLTQYDWTGATTLVSRSITNSVSLVTKV